MGHKSQETEKKGRGVYTKAWTRERPEPVDKRRSHFPTVKVEGKIAELSLKKKNEVTVA